MKKIIYFALVILCMFQSCDSDNDFEATYKNKVIGVWKSYDSYDFQDSSDRSVESTIIFSENNRIKYARYCYNSKGSLLSGHEYEGKFKIMNHGSDTQDNIKVRIYYEVERQLYQDESRSWEKYNGETSIFLQMIDDNAFIHKDYIYRKQ